MITDYGIEGKSNWEIISELGGRFKEYRIFSRLTQKEVAKKSGVSIFTISQFEKGEAGNIGFGTILSLLRSIGFLAEAEKLLPGIQCSHLKSRNNRKERKELDMEGNVLEVKLWEKTVGLLSWDKKRGCATFQFDADFVHCG